GDRAQERRDEEAERECSGNDAPIPPELIDERRHQQRKRRPRRHADGHRHERNADDQPAVVERQARRPISETALHTRLPLRRCFIPCTIRALAPSINNLPGSYGRALPRKRRGLASVGDGRYLLTAPHQFPRAWPHEASREI